MRTLDQLLELDLAGKRVLVRIDTDVEVVDGRVEDDSRLKAALPTIRQLRQAGASLTLIGHRGRPKGRSSAELSLAPVARHLAKLLVVGGRSHYQRDVAKTSPIFSKVYALAKEVRLLENLRFDAGEEDSEPEFVQLLAEGHDYFVNESFATAHRAAASTVGIAKKLPSYAGLRLTDEAAHLSLLLDRTQRPVTLVVGGAKMTEKLGLLKHLLPRVDHVLTGGVVANMLLAAQGTDIKKSLTEPELSEQAKSLLSGPEASKIVVPTDFVWSEDRILDIGPETIGRYRQILKESQTMFWAGSLGMAEVPRYAAGTRAVAEVLAHHSGVRMVGGGDTAAALQRFHLLNKMSFVSTGGGAALEFLAGKSLPALAVLE